MSYKWQTDGSISWRDENATTEPDLPLSDKTSDWADAYAEFSGQWSLLAIINRLVGMIGAIPTGRYWLSPVLNDILDEPAVPSLGDRYIVDGTAATGANWLVDGPAGGPIQDCIAECTAVSPVAWEYWGDPAVWSGAQDYDLNDGASTWNTTDDTYWVYDATGAAWIQCGGTTLEKVVNLTTPGTYTIDATVDRGTTFLNAASGNVTCVLPPLADGLMFKFIRITPAGRNSFDISIADGRSDDVILIVPRSVMGVGGTPIIMRQQYRSVRLQSCEHTITLLGTKEGWMVVDAFGAIRDTSPTDADTAVGGATGSITLAAGASMFNDAYLGRLIYITAGTGQGQIREITGYVGTTQVATVSPEWTTPPDGTSEYEMVTYDPYLAGLGELGSMYYHPDNDDYGNDWGDIYNAPNNYSTISRLTGLNVSQTYGALLLGYGQTAAAGAPYSSAFGYHNNLWLDEQFSFGESGKGQTFRILLSAAVARSTSDEPMTLGTGLGQKKFLTRTNRIYYVTFHITGTWDSPPSHELKSWSGSFVAVDVSGTPTILAGSKNITETGSLNDPDLSIDVDINGTADGIEFQASNGEASMASFAGFADVVELELLPPS